MKTINILSNYSEIDYLDVVMCGQAEVIDGVYKVTYPDNVNIKGEIKGLYARLEEEENNINTLEIILEQLKKEGKVCEYETMHLSVFDCDYGKFTKDY